MMKINYNEDEFDELKETFNIAMGRAASDLAVLLKSFVDLKVPEIKIVEAEKVVNTVLKESVFEESEPVVCFKQGFYNDIFVDGEAVVILNEETRRSLSDILGLDEKMDQTGEIDFMYEMCNLMVGVCLNSISTQLFDREMSFTQPKLISENRALKKLAYEIFQRRNLKWDYTLLAKITFVLRDKYFKSDLLIFISEKANELVHKAVAELVEEE